MFSLVYRIYFGILTHIYSLLLLIMQYEGKIVKILPLETIGQNNTEKRTVILEENRESEYKGGLAFDLWWDKLSMLEGYNEGDIVTVSLNARVREYNGKRYNSISAWKIEKNTPQNGEEFVPPATHDDLPF